MDIVMYDGGCKAVLGAWITAEKKKILAFWSKTNWDQTLKLCLHLCTGSASVFFLTNKAIKELGNKTVGIVLKVFLKDKI